MPGLFCGFSFEMVCSTCVCVCWGGSGVPERFLQYTTIFKELLSLARLPIWSNISTYKVELNGEHCICIDC